MYLIKSRLIRAKAILSAFLLSQTLAGILPLMAAENSNTDSKTEFAEIEQNQKTQKKALSKREACANALALPRAMAGVAAGLSIGVPVRIGKDIRKETRRMASSLRQDMGNEFGLVENLFVIGGSVPFGILGGGILGTIRGTEQAITYGSHQPFSKESLSLKEKAQDPKQEILPSN